MSSIYIYLALLLFLASIGLLIMWRRDQDFWLPKLDMERLSAMLPFDRILDDNKTIRCLDGTLVQVLKVNYIDYSILPKDAVIDLEKRRQAWLDKLAEENAHIRVFTLRNQSECKLEGSFPNEVLTHIHDKWMDGFQDIFHNEHYIVLSVPPKSVGFKKILPKQSKLKQLTDLTTSMLANLNPKILTKDKFCPILKFWARIAIFQDLKIASNWNINEGISTSNLTISKDTLKFDSKYVGAIGISTWGDVCDRELLDEISRLDSELVIAHNLKGQSMMTSLSPRGLEHEAKQIRMSFAGDDAYAEYQQVIDIIKGGEASLYQYQLSIFVASNDKEKCLDIIEQINRLFYQYGITPTRATTALKYLYLSMFPSNDSLLYPAKLLSTPLSHLLSFNGEGRGLDKCDWGKGPIRYFKTANRSGYPLILHESSEDEALAHSIVIAPAGSGKTTLFQHLLGGALRYPDLACFVFDRLKGTYTFTNAVAGEYVALENNLNPFCMEDTKQNRTFLQSLLLMMGNYHDDEAMDIATRAVDIMFSLPEERRILTNLFDEIFPESRLKRELRAWIGKNAYGYYFNGQDSNGKARDSLDMQGHLVSFDMTEILKYPLPAACLTWYIMHRIRQTIQQTAKPSMVFIDETKPQIANPQFQGYVSEMLLEHRKLRSSVSLCFQTADAVVNSPIANVMKDNCPTLFLFPNLKANREDYAKLGINDYEWAYIKKQLPVQSRLNRTVLVKREEQSVILDLDFSDMGNLLSLYKSGNKAVKLVDEIKSRFNNINWVDHYLAA